MNYVEEILNRSKEIHLKKRADYASDPTANPFENFDRSNLISDWFPNSYKSFAVLIGTKIARLGALLITGKTPNNESIDDTFLDLITYVALFYAYWKEKQEIPDKEFQISKNEVVYKKNCQCNFHNFNLDGICTHCGMTYLEMMTNDNGHTSS